MCTLLKSFLSVTIISLVFYSCSSSDEPNSNYAGPWVISYYEQFYRAHEDNPNFIVWFNAHTDIFVKGEIISYGNRIEKFDGLAQNETYDTFKECYKYKAGYFVWQEIIQHATEEELKRLKSDFERYSLAEDDNGYYDCFEMYYEKFEAIND